MCGVVAVLGGRDGAAERSALIERLLEPIVPRGPDGSGVWVDEASDAGLGHRRLSILDLSDAGSQPMVSHDGRWVLTFNGEIYNWDVLLDRLVAEGVHLRGHSDTEMLIEAIAHWGLEAALDAADGMWAFVLWDRHDRQMHLVRDRFGEKPLIFGHVDGQLVVGSVVSVVEAHPRFAASISPDAVGSLLRFGAVVAPLVIYDGLEKVMPGTIVTFDASGRHRSTTTYWHPTDALDAAQRAPFDGGFDDAVDELDRLLVQSLRRRIVADVPVGCFLSGGIDSTLVTSVAAEVVSGSVPTFTIGQDVAGFDESGAARRVASHLGSEHHELIVTDEDSLRLVGDLGRAYDEPFGDNSGIPTMIVSRLARERVTVALGGDAGDELFSGYNRYASVPAVISARERIPRPLRGGLLGAAARVAPHRWDALVRPLPESRRPRLAGVKVAKVLAVASEPDLDAAYMRVISQWADPDVVVPRAQLAGINPIAPDRWPGTSPAVRMMGADLLWYLPDDILVKVDRASMATSLEVRAPYLDRSLVEFAFSLPDELRVADRPKALMREVLQRRVPRSLTDRPKMGFDVPMAGWLRGPLLGWARDLLVDARDCELVNVAPVTAALEEHCSGRADLSADLWNVLSFLEWWSVRRR